MESRTVSMSDEEQEGLDASKTGCYAEYSGVRTPGYLLKIRYQRESKHEGGTVDAKM
jgi:hypothetical protein